MVQVREREREEAEKPLSPPPLNLQKMSPQSGDMPSRVARDRANAVVLNRESGGPLKKAVQKKPHHAPEAPHTVATTPRDHPHELEVRERIAEHKGDERFQHELEEMRETHDLDDIDDDVEDVATLYEWEAVEHNHKPKSQRWFVALAAGATVLVGLQLFLFANFLGALTIGLVSTLVYYIAQKEPDVARYRIMVDGVAVNNTLWHYWDLEAFNVLYEPDNEVMCVILRSERYLAPYLHMEIGDADPVEIREILLEFLEEDQEMVEPLADVIARRFGF